jgi:hypothetical protein
MPFTEEQAREIAEAIGRARGLRDGQLPPGRHFAEALNGAEQCAAFIAAVGQPNAPFPLVRYVPVPVVEADGRPNHG